MKLPPDQRQARAERSNLRGRGREPRGLSGQEVSVLLVLLAALPFLNILGNGFTYDDNTQVLNNPYIRNFRHLGEIFTTTVWSYIGAQGVTNYYRPMMLFGYLLCYQLFGPLAYIFHLVSLVFHALVVLLVFRVAVEIFRNRLAAFVAAGLFALHPVHTESVAWVAAVTDVELTFFYLLTFWFFLRAARPGGGRSSLAQLAMAGGFVLTLMSKEQALTLPVLATAYEHGYRDDRAETTWSQKVGRYYLLWMLAGAYLLFRVRFFGALAPVLQISDLTWRQTLLSAVALVGQYCGKLLWPVELCAFYVFKRSSSVLEPRVLAGFLALVVLAALFVFLWRRARPSSFSILWMLVTLAPVLNPCWMAANVFTERYLYLPSAGFCWLLGMGWAYLWQRRRGGSALWRRVLVGALALLGGLFFLRVVTRNRDWSDDVSLYTKTLAASPDSYHIHNNLGTVYWKQGNVAAAERQWQEALRLAPRNAIILNNLGLLRSKQERYAEAVEYFQRAMRLKPLYTDPHLNLGVAYTEMAQLEKAELQLRAAVALSPLRVDARNKLGRLYSDAGRLAEAEAQFLRSVESEPNGTGYDGLGAVYLRWGDRTRATRAFERAVAVDAYDSVAHFHLGKLYLEVGRREDALREYRAGLLTDPSNAEARAAIEEIKSPGRHANSSPH
jgi:Tfp pilus assembly protein PilF/predicted membrane-bound dolichyl-phosphate-mannose-protein mannosyltransferase